MTCWCGYLSRTRCRLFAYGPADATAIPKPPLSLASFKSRLVLPFWYRLTQVVLEEAVVVVVVLRVGRLVVSMIHICYHTLRRLWLSKWCIVKTLEVAVLKTCHEQQCCALSLLLLLVLHRAAACCDESAVNFPRVRYDTRFCFNVRSKKNSISYRIVRVGSSLHFHHNKQPRTVSWLTLLWSTICDISSCAVHGTRLVYRESLGWVSSRVGR